MSIGQLISVKDKDSMAIGQDPMVLQDITKEIPLDAEWKRCAYQVQATSMDVFNPEMSESYSSTFTDLESLFEWIQKIAKEIKKSPVKEAVAKEFP
jgi:hypothetical protein